MNRSLAGLAGLCLIGLAAPGLTQAPQMSRAQAAQLYAAGGFPISADGKNPTNRCGTPANPKITFVDMNGDKRAEALFIDAGGCYKPDGRWYAVATQGADGSWRGILSGVGTVQAAGTMANGWFVLNVASGGKTQTVVYNGQNYGPRTAVATAPAPMPAAPPPGVHGSAGSRRRASACRVQASRRAGCAGAGIARRGHLPRGRFQADEAGLGKRLRPIRARARPMIRAIEQVKDLNGDGRPEAVGDRRRAPIAMAIRGPPSGW